MNLYLHVSRRCGPLIGIGWNHGVIKHGPFTNLTIGPYHPEFSPCVTDLQRGIPFWKGGPGGYPSVFFLLFLVAVSDLCLMVRIVVMYW